jgi:predicted transcriptional regulator
VSQSAAIPFDRDAIIIEREKNVKTSLQQDPSPMTQSNPAILTLATQIVTAHVRHNDVTTDAIPPLIRSVYDTLLDIGRNFARPSTPPPAPSHHHDHNHNGHNGHRAGNANAEYVHPTYGQTVFEDRLVCMEDGLSMKMLKRHLLTVHGMTPDDYRAKWGLPDEYPMVASTYAKLRSSLALQSGLGLKPEARGGKQRRTY